MPRIELHTIINAPAALVFDLSRSVELHQISTEQSQEKAVGGKTKGLLGLNNWVTWEAYHLGYRQRLTSKITEFNPPHYFVDEMQRGIFKSMRHEHHFKSQESGTKMTDIFEYVSPLGLLGQLADFLFLEKYMTHLLAKRNQRIKEYAESELGKSLLHNY